MNKNEKDFMNQLNNLDDLSVEEIAENYPALDEHSKKRILKKCMRKSGFSADTDDDGREEIVVSGTERYNRASWYKYAASAAAFVIAAVGITSVVLLHRNLNGDDDFELDNPPAVSSYDSEADNVSEQATATTKDRGYVAGGHDYANDTDYSGIIIGGTSQIPPTVDESSAGYTAETDNEPVVNNNNSNTTVQPATQAPVAPPATTVPVVTEPPTTDPPVTEPVTDNATKSEAQKTFLDGRYFIVSDNGKYDGFEFSTDGTIKQFVLNIPYGFKRYTDTVYGYEIIENQFSYGTIGDETNWTVGTIINPNDSTTFSVQFPDGVYTFSTDNSILNTNVSGEIVLAGTSWYGYSDYGERLFTFYNDDINGNYINTQDGIGLAFTYSKNGDEITFHMGDNETVINAKFIQDEFASTFTIQWPDGVIEYFYNGNY